MWSRLKFDTKFKKLNSREQLIAKASITNFEDLKWQMNFREKFFCQIYLACFHASNR